MGINPQQTAVLEGDIESSSVWRALLPGHEECHNGGGAMSWQQRIDQALDERRAAEAFAAAQRFGTHGAGRWLEREGERGKL